MTAQRKARPALAGFSNEELKLEMAERGLPQDITGFADKEIRAEFKARGLLDAADLEDADLILEVQGRGLMIPETEDADRLAEMIAAGATDDALDLCQRIFPDIQHPATTKRLIADRQSHAARLF